MITGIEMDGLFEFDSRRHFEQTAHAKARVESSLDQSIPVARPPPGASLFDAPLFGTTSNLDVATCHQSQRPSAFSSGLLEDVRRTKRFETQLEARFFFRKKLRRNYS